MNCPWLVAKCETMTSIKLLSLSTTFVPEIMWRPRKPWTIKESSIVLAPDVQPWAPHSLCPHWCEQKAVMSKVATTMVARPNQTRQHRQLGLWQVFKHALRQEEKCHLHTVKWLHRPIVMNSCLPLLRHLLVARALHRSGVQCSIA